MRLLLALSSALFVCGCAETQRTGEPAVAIPVTVSKVEPPPRCRPLGAVSANKMTAFRPVRYEETVVALQQEALKRGANYVVVDAVSQTNISVMQLGGRAFQCPAEPAAEAAAPGPCVPDCSPGFVCVSGQCVSACNPLCGTGERCGEDRLCHPMR